MCEAELTRTIRVLLAASCLLIVAVACGDTESASSDTTAGPVDFSLSSPAFEDGGRIPDIHANNGDNVSPPLAWEGVPEDADSLALVVVDPDAQNWLHWIVTDIDPTSSGVATDAVPSGGSVGPNEIGELRWSGPEPPSGEIHTYVFSLHALEESVTITEAMSPVDALEAVDEATLAVVELRGNYRSP